MATYQERVQDYVGAFTDTDALSAWLSACAKYIVDILPHSKVEIFTTEETDAGSGISLEGKRFIRAHKGGYGARMVSPAIKTQLSDTGSLHYSLTSSPSVYIESGKAYVLPGGGTVLTVQYPTVAYSDSTTAKLPDMGDQAMVLYAAIQAAMTKANDALASIDSLTFATQTAPTTPTAPSFTYTDATGTTVAVTEIDISTLSAPTYTKPTASDETIAPSALSISSTAPTAPDAPDISYTDAIGTTVTATEIDISGLTPPTYTKPAASDETIAPSALTLTASAPTAPTAPSFTYTDATGTTVAATTIDISSLTPASYTKPVMVATTAPDEFTLDATMPTAPTAPVFNYDDAVLDTDLYSAITITSPSSSLPEYTKPVTSASFTDLETYIGTDEDFEKAQAEAGNQKTRLEQFQMDLYNELNEFNQEAKAYELELQKVIQQAKISEEVALAKARDAKEIDLQNASQDLARQIAEYKDQVSKYQAEVQGYITDVNAQVQTHAQIVDRWVKIVDREIAEYQADIQNELNEFNADSVEFRTDVEVAIENGRMLQQKLIDDAQRTDNIDLQNEIQSLQKEIAEYNATLGKYSSQVQAYQTEVNAEVQEYVQNLQRWQSIKDVDLRTYQLDIQNELNEFQKELAIYQSEVQEKIDNAQLLQQKLIDDAQRADNIALQNEIQSLQAQVAQYQAELNKYSTEMQGYQTEVTAEVQEYTQNLQRWIAIKDVDLKTYQSDIQNEYNEFQKELAVYQSQVQEKIDNAQLLQQKLLDDAQRADNIALQNEIQTTQTAIAEYQSKLGKYQAEIQSYGTQVSEEYQRYTSVLQAKAQLVDRYMGLSERLKQEYQDLIQVIANVNI